MISKYGIGLVTIVLMVSAAILILTWMLLGAGAFRLSIVALFLLIDILVVNFFRDPERNTRCEWPAVVAPADGRVIVVREVFEEEYLKQDAVQVSIFMSPLNVHVNRVPISGVVEYFKHIPGVHTVAFLGKSSDKNERTHIGISDGEFRVFFKQVAGAVARRIVADITVGQTVKAGERFGMIKFGSRVDVFVPKHSTLQVGLHEKVRAGETILARYEASSSTQYAGNKTVINRLRV